ncbi:hypothetical protein [Paenibacillus tianjinensis]|uniref:Uncharacterized protein n=1 Tax=Paenibacillus tianjinensis TaxID=2810347 RepID=A0ABX7L476_9BACL|nr:hypothetical protein [Paenibacillus tianjinensis]QSF42650.1 hypothetical protein JRJ22_15135 [Paenibacillus tianjinensis]
MNKEDLEKIFFELLEDFEFSEGIVIHDRGCFEDNILLQVKIDNYKLRFKSILDSE